MSKGLLVIMQSEEETWVVFVKGKGLHMSSVIESPWFDNLPLDEFLTKLKNDFGLRLEECEVYYCETFAKLSVESEVVLTLQKED